MAARTLAERFSEKVDRSGGPEACWPWTGGKGGRGYGHIKVDGRMLGTHRVAWELADGQIPDGLYVLHRCDNRPCCNPRHLFLGTQTDNVADMDAKGRRGRRPLNRGEANPRAILTSYGARIVCRMAWSGRWRHKEIAAGFRISREHVSSIKHGLAWASATTDIRGTV